MADLIIPSLCDNPVHFNSLEFCSEFNFSGGVPQLTGFGGFPFMLTQPVKIRHINFGSEAAG